MNRRNFFKTVTGFIAGIFASTAKSKDLCGGQNGVLYPRCKFNADKIPDKSEVSTDELNDMMAKQRVRAAERMARPPYIIDESDFVRLKTYNWIDMGCYKEIGDVRELHCCYTRPSVGRVRVAILCQIDEIELTKKVYEERRRAVKGGAWYPTSKTEYRIN